MIMLSLIVLLGSNRPILSLCKALSHSHVVFLVTVDHVPYKRTLIWKEDAREMNGICVPSL